MKKIIFLCVYSLLIVNVFAQMNEMSKQELSTDEIDKVTVYKALSSGILIDELEKASKQDESYRLDENTCAYEGYQVLQLFGLTRQLTLIKQYQVLKAMFGNISKTSPNNGSGIRNIVISNWYVDKRPLVLQIAKLKSREKNTLIVILLTRRTAFVSSVIKKCVPPDRFMNTQELYSMEITVWKPRTIMPFRYWRTVESAPLAPLAKNCRLLIKSMTPKSVST